MSKSLIFSIRDVKAARHVMQFFQFSDADAIRTFTSILKDKTTIPGQYPCDFDLYFCGYLDQDTGEITSGVHLLLTGSHVAAMQVNDAAQA